MTLFFEKQTRLKGVMQLEDSLKKHKAKELLWMRKDAERRENS